MQPVTDPWSLWAFSVFHRLVHLLIPLSSPVHSSVTPSSTPTTSMPLTPLSSWSGKFHQLHGFPASSSISPPSHSQITATSEFVPDFTELNRSVHDWKLHSQCDQSQHWHIHEITTQVQDLMERSLCTNYEKPWSTCLVFVRIKSFWLHALSCSH